MSCQIHVPAKANTKMGKSFKRHYTTDISVYVYLRINVPEKNRKNKLYHKDSGCDKSDN